MSRPSTPHLMIPMARIQPLIELGLMALIGLFFAMVGPFNTDREAFVLRLVYWIGLMVCGGFLGLLADQIQTRLNSPLRSGWRLVGNSVLVTPVQAGAVVMGEVYIFSNPVSWLLYLNLLPAVLVIGLAAFSLLYLVRLVMTRPAPVPQSDPADATPSEDLWQDKLPARLRRARLVALQAEDHYVRVHTEAGSDLVLMRFSDAVALASATQPGLRLHRSWWAAADAVQSVTYNRGSGQAVLTGDLTAPVSRTYYPALRDAGW